MFDFGTVTVTVQTFTMYIRVSKVVADHDDLLTQSRYIGGFQLLDLIITELKSHMTC